MILVLRCQRPNRRHYTSLNPGLDAEASDARTTRIAEKAKYIAAICG